MKREEEQQIRQQQITSDQLHSELQQAQLREQALYAQMAQERDMHNISFQRLSAENQDTLYLYQQTHEVLNNIKN